MPRMLAFDIDGTLLRNDGMISERVFDALSQVRDRGFLLALATGRPWLATRDVNNALGGLSYGVCLNGAVVFDARTEQMLHSRAISAQQACETARLVREMLPGARLAADLVDGRHIWDHDFATQMPVFMSIEVERADRAEDALAQENVDVLTWLVEIEGSFSLSGEDGAGFSVGYQDDFRDARRIISTLSPVLDPSLEVRHSGVGPAEIAMAGVSKASALEWVADRHGISSSEVMVFGDGFNDVEMLIWAGQSVAMGNALPEVRSHANHVTLTNEQDGVAVVLEELLAADLSQQAPPQQALPQQEGQLPS